MFERKMWKPFILRLVRNFSFSISCLISGIAPALDNFVLLSIVWVHSALQIHKTGPNSRKHAVWPCLSTILTSCRRKPFSNLSAWYCNSLNKYILCWIFNTSKKELRKLIFSWLKDSEILSSTHSCGYCTSAVTCQADCKERPNCWLTQRFLKAHSKIIWNRINCFHAKKWL